MDSREAAERARLAETFLFRGAPPEAVELARTDPRTVRQENGKGGVIYAPHAFRRCLGVVLEGRVQVNKGALIMSVLEPGDLFGAAALFNDRADYATTLTARAPCRVLLLPQALVEELMGRFPEVGRNYVAYLSGRICFLSGKIDALTAGSAERKVAQYLLSRLEGGMGGAGLLRRRPGPAAGGEPRLPLPRPGRPGRAGGSPAGGQTGAGASAGRAGTELGKEEIDMKQKLLSLGLSLALVLGLAAGCAPKAGPEESPAPETTPPAAESTAPVPESPTAAGVEIRLGLLNGPTGMGAAKLLSDSDAGETVNHYEYAIGSDPSTDIVPKLNNGELDIAAVPTNLAATLYNKAGSIKLLALNTLGVLHILENGDTVHSMADLAGKTIYSINQGTNTEYVLNYLLEESGLTPGEDVTIEWKTSEEVTALMASGGIDLCMLPVPAATSVMMQNADVRDAIDLNDVWQEVGAAGTFTMGCVVARSDFVEEHPEAVDAFLTEYAASIAYVNEHPEEAAALVEQYGIVPKAAVAKAAIPQANMVCLTGDELKGISDYYEVLYAADPTSIGGAIPDDNFYYIP